MNFEAFFRSAPSETATTATQQRTHESRRRLFQVSNLRALTTKIVILILKSQNVLNSHTEYIFQIEIDSLIIITNLGAILK